MEYNVFVLHMYDFDVRLFWNWIYEKESLSEHLTHVESVKLKESRVECVKEREKWKVMKK